MESAGLNVVSAQDAVLPSLKLIYENDFLIGNIVNQKYLTGDRFECLKKHYNIATAENEMKPISLAPKNRGGEYNWETADRIVRIMKENDIKIFGHTLVWHNQTPKWMTEGSGEEIEANLKNHINAVIRHFRSDVIAWDVVNEALDENVPDTADWKSCVRASPWYNALGVGYIETAFRTARETDPDIVLYYNDYSLDNSAKANAACNMIKDINDRYLAEGNTRKLIEGIGMQSHYQSEYFCIKNVRRSFEKFIETGIKVAVSELDIRFGDMVTGTGNDTKMSDNDAETQAKQYAELFGLYREFKDHIPRVTMWGMDDHSSWLSKGNPCLFERNLNPKKAFFAAIGR